MKQNTRNFIAILTAILVFGISFASAQNTAKKVKPAATSTTEKESVEKIIREYLLTNPSIIREAMQALQAQEEKARFEKAANNLKTMKSEMYADTSSPVVGNQKGDVTIVVFFDYFCGYCKKSLPSLEALLAKDKSVRVIYKEYPIMGLPSQVASKAALAANMQGKYAEFHKALVESAGASDEEIKSISDKLGLDYAKLKKDMTGSKIDEALTRNYTLASNLDISGTPAYIVGEQLIPGAIDPDALARVVAVERAKSKTANIAVAKK